MGKSKKELVELNSKRYTIKFLVYYSIGYTMVYLMVKILKDVYLSINFTCLIGSW